MYVEFYFSLRLHNTPNRAAQSLFSTLGVSMGVLCGLIVIGLSGRAFRRIRRTRTRDRRDAEFRSAAARASFVSRRNTFDAMPKVKTNQTEHKRILEPCIIEDLCGKPIDRRSEWLRLGLESPSLVFPNKAKTVKTYTEPLEKPNTVSFEADAEENLKSSWSGRNLVVRRSHAPISRSPLGLAPVWSASQDSPSINDSSNGNKPMSASGDWQAVVSLSVHKSNPAPSSVPISSDEDVTDVATQSDGRQGHALGDCRLSEVERDEVGSSHSHSASVDSSKGSSEESNDDDSLETLQELTSQLGEIIAIVEGEEYLESSFPIFEGDLRTDSTILEPSIPMATSYFLRAVSSSADTKSPTLAETTITPTFASLITPSASYLMHSTIPSLSSTSIAYRKPICDSPTLLLDKSAPSSLTMLKDSPLPPPQNRSQASH